MTFLEVRINEIPFISGRRRKRIVYGYYYDGYFTDNLRQIVKKH